MSGLMAPPQEEMAPEAAPAAPAPGASPVEAGTEQATPAEEAQVEALMQPMMDAIHGKGSDATLAKLKAGRKDLPGTIGEMAAHMMIGIEQRIAKDGGKIEDSVKVEVGQEIVIDLIEIAAAANLIEDADEAKGELFKEAMLNAIGAYGDLAAQAGLIDRDQARQQLGQMTQGNENPIAKNIAGMLQQGGQQGGQPPATGAAEVQA